MISYMQGTKFFKKPVISKSAIHKTVMDKDFLYLINIGLRLLILADFLHAYVLIR